MRRPLRVPFAPADISTKDDESVVMKDFEVQIPRHSRPGKPIKFSAFGEVSLAVQRSLAHSLTHSFF